MVTPHAAPEKKGRGRRAATFHLPICTLRERGFMRAHNACPNSQAIITFGSAMCYERKV